MAVRVLGERAKSLVLENRRLTEQNQAGLLSAGLRLGDIELACHLAKGQIHQDEGGADRTARISASRVTASLINYHEPVNYQRSVHSAHSAPHNAFSISPQGHSNALSDTTSSEHRSGDEQVGASSLQAKPRSVPGVPQGTAEMSVCGNGIGNDEMGVGGTIHPQVGVIDSAVSSSVFSGSPRVLSVRSVPSHNSDGPKNTSMENSGAGASGAIWQPAEETARGDSIEIVSQSLSSPRRSRVHWVGSESRTPLHSSGSENEVPNPADTIRVDEQVRRPRSLRDQETPTMMKASSSRVRSKIGGEGVRVAQACRKWEGDVMGGPTVGFHY
jgi:hypothetical protein